MPTGRPTEYSPEILKKVKKYLDSSKDETERIIDMENEEKGYQKYRNRLIVNLPSVARLAIYLKVARSTIYEWASQEDKKEFSDILELILAEQEKTLIEKGLSGDYNANIAKLALGKHGYKESQEVDQKVSGALSLTDLFNKAKEE